MTAAVPAGDPGATCDGLGWCVKRDAAPLGEPWCNGAGRCVKGYASTPEAGDPGALLDRLEEARKAASEGGWAAFEYHYGTLPEALPDLIRLARDGLALRDAVLAIHERAEIHTVSEIDEDGVETQHAIYDDGGELIASTSIEIVCSACAPRMGVPWPCATAQAVGITSDDGQEAMGR